MRIVDRYLLRQFLQAYVICFCSLVGLFIVFDAFTHIDEFIKYAEGRGNLLALMGEYYAYRAVFFFDRINGVLTLIAAMFTVTWIQRYNELTALMAAGLSRGRVIAPVIGGTIAISILAATSREIVVPNIAGELSRDPNDLVGTEERELRPLYDNETNILLRGEHTLAGEKQIKGPTFWLPISMHEWSKELAAANAYYQPPQADRPGGYWMKEVTKPRNINELESLKSADGKPLIITPQGAPWLEPNECFVVSGVTFDQLTGSKNFRKFSSTATLIRALRNRSLDFGADVRVAIHGRMVQPFLDVTLLFLGLPLVLKRENRNLFLAIGLCIAVVCGFMVISLGCQYLGKIYLLDSSLAAWLPLMIFLPIAVGMSDVMKR